MWFCVNGKPTCFGLTEFALITGLNCSAYPRESKMNKVLEKGQKFYHKITKNMNITGDRLLSLIKSQRLDQEQKLKCSLLWFVHAVLLAHDSTKIVESSHIKMADDLDFFMNYPWGKKCFELTLLYLKNKTNLKKLEEIYKEKKYAAYALYGFPWAFLVINYHRSCR